MAEELLEFRKENQISLDQLDVPVRSENRRLTDVIGIILLVIYLLIFLPIFVLVVMESDLESLRLMTDSSLCKNTCGRKNVKNELIPCSGEDFTGKPYHYNSTCVEKCPNGTKKFRFPKRCEAVGKESGFEVLETLGNSSEEWWKFIIIFSVTISLSVGALFALKHATKPTVWISMIGAIVLILLYAAFSWYCWWKGNFEVDYLPAAIIGTLLFVLMCILICVCRKDIKFVIVLIKYTMEAVFAMKRLLFIPILGSLGSAAIVVINIFLAILMGTSINKENFEMKMFWLCTAGIVVLWMLSFWLLMLWKGLIYMVISGTLSAWYFARDKNNLKSPVCTSFYNTFRFHFGTVALGSYIVMVAMVLRTLLESLTRNNVFLNCLVECCCICIEDIINYITTRAYIETAIHAQPFCKSGKRAYNLLLDNVGKVIHVAFSLECVILFITMFIVIVGTIISWLLFKDLKGFWILTFLCLFINFFIISLVFSVFSIAVDTTFICFCEDKAMNNGVSRPYYMPKALMEYIEEIKKEYNQREESQ